MDRRGFVAGAASALVAVGVGLPAMEPPAGGGEYYLGTVTIDLRRFDTRALFAAANVPAPVVVAATKGYATAGDGGGAFYRRVGSEPSHALNVRTADLGWWELVPDSHGQIDVRQAGAVGDGVTDDGQAFIAAAGA